MENKRTLISEDQNMLKEIIKDIDAYTPALAALKSAHNSLDLGELTNDVFKEIIESGAAVLKELFFCNLNKELDTIGLKKDAFRKPYIDQANETFNNIVNALKDLRSVNPDPYLMKRLPTLALKDISFFDGKFQVSAMDQENIMESHCRVYLNNTTEHLLYSKLVAVRDSVNDFNICMDDIAVSNELSGLQALDYIGSLKEISVLHQFLIDDDTKQINPQSIKWFSDMINRAKIQKAKQNERKAASLPYDRDSIIQRNKELQIQQRSDLKKANKI